jgi:nucleotide-binding universal stress UspA family protein
MKPNFVVLTDSSPAGERAQAYAAALAEPLGAALHLVHVVQPMLVTTLEYGLMPPLLDMGYVRELRQALANAAAALPVPATAEVIETDWYDAVQQALDTHRPLLLIAGLTATHGRLEEWLNNRALPLAHHTGYPLLLVPEHLPAANLKPPRRLVLAVEDRTFTLTPEARALAPLLAALGCEVLATTVFPPEGASSGDAGWRSAQRSGLVPLLAHRALHKVVDARPAAGIWQATDELEADMLALLDQGHGWVHKMFSGSTIAHAVRFSQVPVLLLSATLDDAANSAIWSF